MFDNSFGYKGHRVDIEVTEVASGRWRWCLHIDGTNRTDLHGISFTKREMALMNAATEAKIRIDSQI